MKTNVYSLVAKCRNHIWSKACLSFGGRMILSLTLMFGFLVVSNFSFAQALGDYRSAATGNWNSAATWQRFNGVSWLSAATSPSSADGVITIQNGHNVTVTANVTIDQAVVANGGTLTVNNSAVVITLADGAGTDLIVSGTLVNTGTAASSFSINAGATIAFNNGGVYNHARNGGVIPSATWANGSTCLITGVTNTVPSGLTQAFHHFTWNCSNTSSTFSDLGAALKTVNGNLSLLGNNGKELRIVDGNNTLNIGGDIVINGNANDTYDLARSGTVVINVGGDWRHISGFLRANVNMTVNFNKTGVQVFERESTNANAKDDNKFFIHFVVKPGSTLQMFSANTVVNSQDKFTLEAGATLGIRSDAGIASTGASGNIRVAGTRTYSTGANYIYNGGAVQNAGNGLPSTVNNLTVSGNNTVLTLNNSKLDVTMNLAIEVGAQVNLGTFTSQNHTASTLSLGGSGAASGTWGGTGSGATNINTTYFANSGTTSKVQVGLSSCPNPLVTGLFSICEAVGSTTQLTGKGTPATVNPWVSSAPADYSVSNTGLVTRLNDKLRTSSIITYRNIQGCTENVTVGTNIPASVDYYSKPTGNLNDLTTWTKNSDGTGDNPVSFNHNNIFHLQNGSVARNTLSSAWDVGSKLSVENNIDLKSNGYLTLKSFCSHTGFIGELIGAAMVSGEVTVERFVSALDNRAWRMLAPAVNTVGGSKPFIKDNWQEGINKTNPWAEDGLDVNPGYGTHITGSATGANGFDATPTGAGSLFFFNPTTQGWTLASNTHNTNLSAKMGYLLFVRGGRDIDLTASGILPSSSTTLRATGVLLKGDQVFAGLDGGGLFHMITNPFASPIDWVKAITFNGTTNFTQFLYVWDPNIGVRGGYVAITGSGSSSNAAASNLSRNIQSNQAFFIQTTPPAGSHSFIIKEEHKADNNSQDVFRVGTPEQLNIGLFYTDSYGRRRNADGVLVDFNNAYSAGLGAEDAKDLENWDENLSLVRGGQKLSIEGRPLIDNADTLFLNVNRLKQQAYELELQPINFAHPNLQGFVIDKFLGTQTPINLTGTTVIPFTVNSNSASSATDRFEVVFRSASTLPVSITSVKAFQKNNGVQVEWTVQNEINMDNYEVEHSADARSFKSVGSQKANGSTVATYNVFDANAITGVNYYRIKSIGKSGDVQYSQVVKVNIGKGGSGVSVYPNPIKGNTISLNLSADKGDYTVVITNNIGQQLFNRVVNHGGGSSTQTINLGNNFVKGTYQLTVTGEKFSEVIQVIKQ